VPYPRDMIEDPALPARLTGGLWGHLVGDALGVPYEFGPPVPAEDIRFGTPGGRWRQPPGTWSDDGSLMLALLDSLLATGFDPEDQGRRAVEWYRHHAYTPDGDGRFDVGATTSQALEAIEAGTPAEEAGPAHSHSAGNGSVMRILPLALVERDSPDAELIDHAERASSVTHREPRARASCALYSLLVRRLLRGESDRRAALDDSIDVLAKWYLAMRDEVRQAALRHILDARAAFQPGGGSAWDAFWSAWEAFDGAETYQGALRRAVSFGGDTDTVAAITGGLAGVYWGIDAIPAEWRATMRGAGLVARLADRLVETDGWRTSSGNPLRVDWVDLGRVPGFAGADGSLGMTMLPGKRRLGWTGPNWRDPEADADRLRDVHRVDTFLLLVEDVDLEMSRALGVVDTLERRGIQVIRHPVRDLDVPADRNAFGAVLDETARRIRGGMTVVVACRGGLGRTGTAVACLLRDGGLDAAAAMRVTRETRPGTIERIGQEEFVRSWERRAEDPPPGRRHEPQ
jgi:ADP-ribosyl-[dinitrogen reductase] hydrolase